jgi:hypothetical protein
MMGRPMRDLVKEGPFGRLNAIKYVGRKFGGNAYWLCRCECGEELEVRGSHLVDGNVKSCGCLTRDNCAELGCKSGGWNRTHGASGTPTFQTWRGMFSRCFDPGHESYEDYGGRGIKVCDRWLEYENFVADMGQRPVGMTLDRENTDGNYEPGNCRWATNREQQTNKRNNVNLTFGGRTQTMVEWAEERGLDPGLLWQRIRKLRWPVEKALTTPIKERKVS